MKITKTNYNELRTQELDNNFAKVWHVNEMCGDTSNLQSKFTVDTGTVTVYSSITINADAGAIALSDPVGGGQANFTVNNNKVTASSIILLTFKIDDYFYNKVGPKLSTFINGLFMTEYAVTSLKEYYGVGFEKYLLSYNNHMMLKKQSPVLFNKIERLMRVLNGEEDKR